MEILVQGTLSFACTEISTGTDTSCSINIRILYTPLESPLANYEIYQELTMVKYTMLNRY